MDPREVGEGQAMVVAQSRRVGQRSPVCFAMAGRHDRLGAGIYGNEAPAPLCPTGNGPSGQVVGTQWTRT